MKQKKQKKASLLPLVLIVLSIVLVAVSVVFVQTQTPSPESKAATGPASILLTGETNGSMTTVTVKGNSTVGLGYAELYFTFDKATIRLANEITLGTPLTTAIFTPTTKANANSTGQIKIIVGLPPENLASPAMGTFEIAKIPMEFVNNPPQSGTLTLDTVTSYVSDLVPTTIKMDAVSYTMAGQSPTTAVSPTNMSASPTLTRTPTPRPTATGVVLPTNTQAHFPTTAVTATSTPRATVTATKTPTKTPTRVPTARITGQPTLMPTTTPVISTVPPRDQDTRRRFLLLFWNWFMSFRRDR